MTEPVEPVVQVRKVGFMDWQAKVEGSYGIAFGSGFFRGGAIRDAVSRYRRRAIPWDRKNHIEWRDVE